MYNIPNVVFGEDDNIRGISSEVFREYVRMNKSLIKINPYPKFFFLLWFSSFHFEIAFASLEMISNFVTSAYFGCGLPDQGMVVR